jgi:hypothetical protein
MLSQIAYENKPENSLCSCFHELLQTISPMLMLVDTQITQSKQVYFLFSFIMPFHNALIQC